MTSKGNSYQSCQIALTVANSKISKKTSTSKFVLEYCTCVNAPTLLQCATVMSKWVEYIYVLNVQSIHKGPFAQRLHDKAEKRTFLKCIIPLLIGFACSHWPNRSGIALHCNYVLSKNMPCGVRYLTTVLVSCVVCWFSPKDRMALWLNLLLAQRWNNFNLHFLFWTAMSNSATLNRLCEKGFINYSELYFCPMLFFSVLLSLFLSHCRTPP